MNASLVWEVGTSQRSREQEGIGIAADRDPGKCIGHPKQRFEGSGHRAHASPTAEQQSAIDVEEKKAQSSCSK